jgi:MarR family transcriptional regulator for hemolysin
MNSGNSDILGIFALVSSASARSRRAAEAKLRERGLTFAQYGALVALVAHDGLSQAELAQALETDSTTAMVLRGSLEKKRLVDRKADPGDARIRRIVLTNAGKNLVTQVRPEITALFAPGKDLFSDADMKKLASLLEKLRGFALSILPTPEEPEGGKRKPGRPRKVEAAAPKRGKKVAAKKVVAKKTVKAAPKKAKGAKTAAKRK